MSQSQTAENPSPSNGQHQRTGGAKTPRKSAAKTTAPPAAQTDPPTAPRKRRSKAQIAAQKAAAARKLAAQAAPTSIGARTTGKGPPELIAAMFNKIPAVGTKWSDEEAVLFLETLAGNMKLEYGLKGSITVTAKAA